MVRYIPYYTQTAKAEQVLVSSLDLASMTTSLFVNLFRLEFPDARFVWHRSPHSYWYVHDVLPENIISSTRSLVHIYVNQRS